MDNREIVLAMNPKDLIHKVKELDKKATSGPWYFLGWAAGRNNPIIVENRNLKIAEIDSLNKKESNAWFIVESRTLLPQLAELYEKQQEDLLLSNGDRMRLSATVKRLNEIVERQQDALEVIRDFSNEQKGYILGGNDWGNIGKIANTALTSTRGLEK